MCNLATHHHHVGEFDTATRWWRRAADAGNTRAMFNLAVTLAERGDSAGAEDWYRRAAEAGNAASGNLGILRIASPARPPPTPESVCRPGVVLSTRIPRALRLARRPLTPPHKTVKVIE
jgi:TPR repeat protein